MGISINQLKYWDEFYGKFHLPNLPSQFAVFVAAECEGTEIVLDIGCGSGHDSFFFANMGFKVFAIDASSSALHVCRERASHHRAQEAITFAQQDISDIRAFGQIADSMEAIRGNSSLVIYARFFVHAISAEDENTFLELSSKLISQFGGMIALEFRTVEDRLRAKVTGEHFRRFIDSDEFSSKVQKFGLEVSYFVEGIGFAKLGKDDAHVARYILTKKGDS